MPDVRTACSQQAQRFLAALHALCNGLLALKCRSFEEPASYIEGTMQPGAARLRYSQPEKTNIARCIEIGIAMPTADGIETGKAFALAGTDMQTAVAHLRRIGRGHPKDDRTRILSLVGQKPAQLMERPTVTAAPLGFRPWLLIRALPNTRQVFKSNRPAGLYGIRDEGFTDLMVGLLLKPCFPPRQPCQKLPASAPGTSGAFRGFLLESCPQPAIPITDGCQLLATPVLIIAGVGNINTPQINTQYILGLSRGRSRAGQLDMQEERTILTLDQDGAGRCLAFESGLLPLAQDRIQPCAVVEQGQTEGPVPLPKTEDALIVVNRGRGKGRMGFCRNLEGCAYACNGPNGQIGRQPKTCPHIRIAGMLDLHFIRGMFPPCDIRNEVAGIGKRAKRGVEFGGLLRGWCQLAGYGARRFHSAEYITYERHMQKAAEAWQAFPPLPLKRRGFHGLKPYFCDAMLHVWEQAPGEGGLDSSRIDDCTSREDSPDG